MAVDTIDATLHEIDKWAGRAGVGVDARDLRLLLELSRDHLAHEQPGAFALGDLDELLLEVIPENVVLDSPEHARDVIRAASTLLAFLDDTNRLPHSQIEALDAELEEAGPEFFQAVMSPEELAELFEPDDSLVTILEQFGVSPDDIPPMRLPDHAELAAAARQSKLMNQAHKLGEWTGDGRALTERGDLTPDDIVSAAAVLGIELSDAEAAPEIALLVQLADFTGFAQSPEDDGGTLMRGDALDSWPDGDDETVIALWQSGLAVTLGFALDWLVDVYDGEIEFEGVGATAFLMLFLSRDEGMPMAALTSLIEESAEDRQMLQAWTEQHGDPARTLVEQLVLLGAATVSHSDGEDVIRLTPLGLSTMRDELIDSGVDVALLPPVTEMTAADLVGLSSVLTEAQMAAELGPWLESRGLQDGARDLLTVASDSGGAYRVWATSAVMDLGAEADPVWRSVLDDPALRPYAKLALAGSAGYKQPDDVPAEFALTFQERAWFTIDAIALIVAVPSDHTPLAIAAALSMAPKDILDNMWRLPHPQVIPVLQAVGDLHPDKKVAKHARTVANKASSYHSQG
ncbi:hypothetical protein JOF56_001407 [Kibdelosporangium banguiense]|uniref:Uncharacterized protein n=1 Tax=Kibdelosporangium banguiense TaxID=1365924 RepID=A0ABS4T9D7_9PSEU|nr:hypothetical protein [Kibdelosporangium banguiense]MBP2321022.1 hypothetical protein [Kibdelosporangium banguiense]